MEEQIGVDANNRPIAIVQWVAKTARGSCGEWRDVMRGTSDLLPIAKGYCFLGKLEMMRNVPCLPHVGYEALQQLEHSTVIVFAVNITYIPI